MTAVEVINFMCKCALYFLGAFTELRKDSVKMYVMCLKASVSS
jgi:hypothetical protein